MSYESRLRGFLSDTTDDLDLEAVFLSHADSARARADRLARRLAELPGADEHPAFPSATDIPSTLTNANRIAEERAVQDLIIAVGIHRSECAMGETLAAIGAASRDEQTERLGQEMQSQASQSAERVFSLIRSRSKIAFNMLTPNELDPAVDTKMADNRVV
jgi:hypothetical protein